MKLRAEKPCLQQEVPVNRHDIWNTNRTGSFLSGSEGVDSLMLVSVLWSVMCWLKISYCYTVEKTWVAVTVSDLS